MSSDFRIIVIGGGLGGLTLALACLRFRIPFDLYEQAKEFGTVGAGVEIAPNATRALNRLGLEKEFEAISSPFSERYMVYRDYRTGDELATAINDISPSRRVYRSELLDVLLKPIPKERLHTGKQLVRIEERGQRRAAVFKDGTEALADLIIGADGIKSEVRKALGATHEAVFSGQVAYRGLIPMHELDEEALPVARDTTNFSGPKRHFLIYPIGADYRTLNIVAFIPEPRHKDESWTSQGTLEDLSRELEGWNPRVRSIVETWKKLQDTTMKQALYEHEPLDKWTDGHLVVMGDAAHAMLPHQGQGTGQAIEDGVTLALCLQGANAGNIHRRLELYFHLRKERTDRVVNTSREAGRIASNANPDKRTPVDLDAMKKRWQWLWKHDVFEAFEGEKDKYF